MVKCWVVNLEHICLLVPILLCQEKVYKRAVSCKLLLLMHVSIVFIYCKYSWAIKNVSNTSTGKRFSLNFNNVHIFYLNHKQ